MMDHDFKNFDHEIFNQELRTRLFSEKVLNYTSFEDNCLGVLNKNTQLKKKYLVQTMHHMLLRYQGKQL